MKTIPSVLKLSLFLALGTYNMAVYAASDTEVSHNPVQACDGKADGDACQFTGRKNNTMSGVCRKAPGEKGGLICVPELKPKEGQ